MSEKKRVIATVGTFDGVHRGHQLVIGELMRLAGQLDAQPLIITFDRHPLQLIAPHRAPKRIMTVEEELNALSQTGAQIILLHFDEQLRKKTALQWLQDMKERYGITTLLMGYDNTFGSDGRHLTPEQYIELGKTLDIQILQAPVADNISSTAVRHALRDGDVATAADMLGRNYELTGEVVHGDAIGRTIGRPTANISVDPSLQLPADGVYAALAYPSESAAPSSIVPRPSSPLKAIVNIGKRPTFQGQDRRIEANILDFSGDLYGKILTLSFITRLRGEKSFPTIEALKQQLALDEAAAKQILKQQGRP